VVGGTAYDLFIRAHHPAQTNRLADPIQRVER
jgi:hypothetical protein